MAYWVICRTLITYQPLSTPLLNSTIELFRAINSAIASCVALPKVCKSRFDIKAKKEDDGYKGLHFTER